MAANIGSGCTFHYPFYGLKSKRNRVLGALSSMESPLPLGRRLFVDLRPKPAKAGTPYLNLDIFGPYFQAFVLILPNGRRIMVEQFGHNLPPGHCQERFGLGSGLLETAVVIAFPLALRVVPMRHGMHWRIGFGPGTDRVLQLGRDVVEHHARLAAMLTYEARFQNIARKQWQQRRPATPRFRV